MLMFVFLDYNEDHSFWSLLFFFFFNIRLGMIGIEKESISLKFERLFLRRLAISAVSVKDTETLQDS